MLGILSRRPEKCNRVRSAARAPFTAVREGDRPLLWSPDSELTQGKLCSTDQNEIPGEKANVLTARDGPAVYMGTIRTVQVFNEEIILCFLDHSMIAGGQDVIKLDGIGVASAYSDPADYRDILVAENKEHAAGF